MRALVALGSNLGDREGHLASGLDALSALGPTIPSPLVLETPDESGTGTDYLNTVAFLESRLDDPAALLEELLRIELRLGRDRSAGRNAPRTLDLDLISVDGIAGAWRWAAPPDLRFMGPELELQLPHPRAKNRSFVLEPVEALGPLLPGGPAAWMVF